MKRFLTWSGIRILQVSAVAGLVQIGSGCAGRDARPVAISQFQDNTATCAQIQAETDANAQRIGQLSSEEGWKVAQNVGAGMLGFFTLGIAWAGMDFQDAAGIERQALESRNSYLAQLSVEKCKQIIVETP